MNKTKTLLSIVAGATMLLTSCSPRMYQTGKVQGVPSHLEKKTTIEVLEGIEITGGKEKATFKIADISNYEQDYTGKVLGINYYKKYLHIGGSFLFMDEKTFENQDTYWIYDVDPMILETVDVQAELSGGWAVHVGGNLPTGKNTNMSISLGYRCLQVHKTGVREQAWTTDTGIEKYTKTTINERIDKSTVYMRVGSNYGLVGLWVEGSLYDFALVDGNPMFRVGATLNIPLQHRKKIELK